MKVITNVVEVRPADNLVVLDAAVYSADDRQQDHPTRIEIALDAEFYVEDARFIGPEYEKMQPGFVTDAQMVAYKRAKDHIEKHLDAIKREALMFSRPK